MRNKELLLQNSGLTRLELIVKIAPLYPGDTGSKVIGVCDATSQEPIYSLINPLDGYALAKSQRVLAGSLSTNTYTLFEDVTFAIQGTMFYDDLEVGYFKNDRFYFYSTAPFIGKAWESLLGKTFIILS